MSGHEHELDDVALFALGTLSQAEAERIGAHIAQCAECAAELRNMREIVDVLPLAAVGREGPAPRPELKARVMAIARSGEAAPLKSSFPVLPYALAAAFLAAAIIMGTLYASLSRQVSDSTAAIADLVSAGAQRYSVPGGEVVRSGGRVYVAMRSLPAPPPGKVYQTWTLPRGAKRVSPSVTFVPKNGRALLRLPVDARRIAAVAVSVEPAGGSKQPTSKPLFVLKLPQSKT